MKKLSITLFAAMVALVLLGGSAVYAEDHETVGGSAEVSGSSGGGGGREGGDGLFERANDSTAPVDGVWDTNSDEDLDSGKVKSNS